MSTRYTLQRKKNPQKPDEPGKWYAVPQSNTPMDEDAATRAATEDTTFSDVELAAASKLIARFVMQQLVNGQRARIPGLGTFRTTFRSKGVDNIDDFDANTMITDPRISFITDTKLRADFLRDLRFENAGVREEDIYYGDLASYRAAKGQTPGQTPGTGTSGSGEEEGGGDYELG